ncbi:flagellar assembly protein FliX [Acidiphilium sp. AL]|uniref:Flagellar assembly protein FliX n=1 Tax=Acidiphilium iwatense TaxID=768198 RepID=A0ABS9DYB9_9PROT|nr:MULTISPECIES: flagellar assembly protein FliX [Acidiphilium]MCF3946691.1 flagellar assembly protein FliX [Acidiphilium iwatense]MCU4160016.1 flagellar assembly protein FliX [Acidiphilium sp. AL]
MTRIASLGRFSPLAMAAPSPRPDNPDFTVTSPPPRQAAVVTPAGLTGLIALQDDESPSRRDRAAQRGARQALDALGELQAALLGGSQSTAMAALNDAVERMAEPADPALGAIIGAIRLRARIELARRRRI